MKLIAYDPSIIATGVASLEDGRVLEGWTIKTKTKGTDRYAEIAKQLFYDLLHLSEPEDSGLPDYAVIEMPDAWTRKVRYGEAWTRQNAETNTVRVGAPANVLSLQKVCTVVGVIIGVCTAFGLPVRLYTPKQWKGKKSKRITQNELGFQGYDIEELGWDDHACDAAALALWAAGQIRPEYLMQVEEHVKRGSSLIPV